MANVVYNYESEEVKNLFERFSTANPSIKEPSMRQVLGWMKEEDAALAALQRRSKLERESALDKAQAELKKAQIDVETQLTQDKLEESKLDLTIGSSINQLIEGQCKASVKHAKVFNQLAMFKAMTSVINPMQLWKF